MASASDPNNSTTDLRHDIEGWRQELAKWEVEGLVKSKPAETIRGWIDAVEKIITDGWQ